MPTEIINLGGSWHIQTDDPALRAFYGGSQQPLALTAKVSAAEVKAILEAKHPGKTFTPK